MSRAALVSTLLAASCGGWHPQDTVLEASFAAVTAMDWHQTRVITSLCNEENPILGSCGERMSVDAYFPLVIALHVAASMLVPRTWRPIWQGATLGGEAGTVWSNWREDYAHPAYPATAITVAAPTAK